MQTQNKMVVNMVNNRNKIITLQRYIVGCIYIGCILKTLTYLLLLN